MNADGHARTAGTPHDRDINAALNLRDATAYTVVKLPVE